MISAFHNSSEVPPTTSSFRVSSGGALRLDGQRQRLPPRRGFGLRLHDVDRRHGAHIDPDPVVRHELLGQRQRQRQRLPLHAHGGARVDQVPVGQTDVGQRVDDSLFDVDVGDVPVDARDDQLRAPRIGPKAAQQRLLYCSVMFAPKLGSKVEKMLVDSDRVVSQVTSYRPPPHFICWLIPRS